MWCRCIGQLLAPTGRAASSRRYCHHPCSDRRRTAKSHPGLLHTIRGPALPARTTGGRPQTSAGVSRAGHKGRTIGRIAVGEEQRLWPIITGSCSQSSLVRAANDGGARIGRGCQRCTGGCILRRIWIPSIGQCGVNLVSALGVTMTATKGQKESTKLQRQVFLCDAPGSGSRRSPPPVSALLGG